MQLLVQCVCVCLFPITMRIEVIVLENLQGGDAVMFNTKFISTKIYKAVTMDLAKT